MGDGAVRRKANKSSASGKGTSPPTVDVPPYQIVIDILVFIRNLIFSTLYRLLKGLLFKLDPEWCHDAFNLIGRALASNFVGRWITRMTFGYSHPMLRQDVFGATFENPIGLSAGFDKNAELLTLMPECGFGFEEAGSITGEYCAGNPKPRVWRLPRSKSLHIWYGLKNDGAEVCAERIRQTKGITFPFGTSIARTNSETCANNEMGIADFVKAHKNLADLGTYTAVNISCPNAFGGEAFAKPEKLDALLSALDKVKTKKPTLLKLAAYIPIPQLNGLIDVAIEHGVKGVICCNLWKEKSIDNADLKDPMPEKGGLSGLPVKKVSTEMVRHIYTRTRHVDDFVIIGVGGIFNGADAYEKIKAGATLCQMITGMIFEGPQVVSQINLELVSLLKKDGYSHISEAIGADHRK